MLITRKCVSYHHSERNKFFIRSIELNNNYKECTTKLSFKRAHRNYNILTVKICVISLHKYDNTWNAILIFLRYR